MHDIAHCNNPYQEVVQLPMGRIICRGVALRTGVTIIMHECVIIVVVVVAIIIITLRCSRLVLCFLRRE